MIGADGIGRVMRVCTQRLLFEEVEPDKWAHNVVSLQLLAPPVQALISHWLVLFFSERKSMLMLV